MHRAATNPPTWEPRLVEARPQENGNVVEVFEVAPGELVVVESGPTFTFPDDATEVPHTKR